MSMEHEEKVVRRKKRMSKKTKKGWRKGSDITDVETFLEKTRGEERKGYFMSSLRHVLSDNKFLVCKIFDFRHFTLVCID